MRKPDIKALGVLTAAMVMTVATATALMAHGDMAPKAVDTSALPQLGAEWRDKNPYSGNAKAVEIGASAYNSNCARCHGLDAVSGGIAPDLRYLEAGQSGDQWFIEKFRKGATRDGKVYMPAFGEVLGQEAGWAIRAWLETKHEE